MTSKVPNPPPDNIFAIDLNPYKTFLVDLPELALIGMRKEQDGWEGVRQEIIGNQPTYGDRAGITATDAARFTALDGQHAKVQAELPPVNKALEVLIESLAHVDNQRHRLVSQIATSAESHASAEGGDPTLLTAYEKTLAYRSSIADKAVKTRKKNEEAARLAAEATGEAEEIVAVGAIAAKEPKVPKSISRVPNPPPDAIFKIDLNPLKSFLVDLPAGAMRGMRSAQDGWEEVRQEIVVNQPKYGDRAGVADTDFKRFVALNDQYDQILVQVPLLEKAAEVLTESEAYLDNLRHKLVTQFADAAEAHATSEGGDPTLRTAYEKTIAYRSIIADKAVKTRKKQEEKKRAGAGATELTEPAKPIEPIEPTKPTEPTEPTKH